VFSEVIAKNSVTVAEQEARELVKGKCFSQLLCGALRGRISGHIEVQDATSVMGQHQKHVEYLEADRRHREEVNRNQLLGVILQECAPGLRRRCCRWPTDRTLLVSDSDRNGRPEGMPRVDGKLKLPLRWAVSKRLMLSWRPKYPLEKPERTQCSRILLGP
jgi:hypothetical protein